MKSHNQIDAIVRPKNLVQILGIHMTTLWRWIQAGEFPQPMRLNKKTIGWRQSTVEEWLRNCEEKNDD